MKFSGAVCWDLKLVSSDRLFSSKAGKQVFKVISDDVAGQVGGQVEVTLFDKLELISQPLRRILSSCLLKGRKKPA